MKKMVLLVLLLLCITGCEKKDEKIEGIIEKNTNTVISIHYPKTRIRKLDKAITKYIQEQHKQFKKDYENNRSISELNIDYEYHKNGNYYQIVLITFISSNDLINPIYKIKTFVFDADKNTFLTLLDIANEKDLSIGKIKQELIEDYKNCISIPQLEETFSNLNTLQFTFDENSIVLYFNPDEIMKNNYQIIEHEIVFSKFKVHFEQQEKNQTVQYQKKERDLDVHKPTIALTFDDGPSKYTKEIIEILNEYDANATFFILGNKVEFYRETLERSLSYGNELGNHSYNHKYLSKLSVEELKKQIELTNQIVQNTLHYEIKYLRPTYGSVNQKLKKNSNLEIVLWNVDTKDWKIKNGKKIAEKALNDIKDGKVILMHDIYKTTLEALKIMLPELKKQGYQIVTVSELKEIQKLRNAEK